MTSKPITIAAVGLDHRHIYTMVGNMLSAGAVCKGWWTEGEPEPLGGFVKRFPDLPRVAERQRLIEDPEIDLVLTAAPFDQRAAIAIEAMQQCKDVLTDKPGCVTLDQLAQIQATVGETGRIWSVDFSEHFEVPATLKAVDLVREGAVGRVLQTVGLGPHRLNAAIRPDWFWNRRRFGGILCDIGSHQIDQFLVFTNSETAEIAAASARNLAHPQWPDFQDFGEVLLRNDHAHGYIRVDWFTPDGLPTWGDGRLTILGTEGYIELRKYVDISGRPGTDHLFLVNGTRNEYIDCSAVPLTFFERLSADVANRTQTAMKQSHAFKVMELAITAQNLAERAMQA